MHVIAKRTVMFYNYSSGAKVPQKHIVHFSKDIQEIPDWIGEQEAFKIATQDGTMTVVRVEPPARISPVEQSPLGEAVIDLQKLNKADLQTHAREVYDLELDDKLKKDEMIAAIEEKQAAK